MKFAKRVDLKGLHHKRKKTKEEKRKEERYREGRKERNGNHVR